MPLIHRVSIVATLVAAVLLGSSRPLRAEAPCDERPRIQVQVEASSRPALARRTLDLVTAELTARRAPCEASAENGEHAQIVIRWLDASRVRIEVEIKISDRAERVGRDVDHGMVRVALVSALESRYPRGRLDIIAIDDGSTDDTFSHIEAVARAYPGRVRALRKEKNEGKRAALHDGFLQAMGDVVVTVDSDSKLDPDALRAIVSPLVRDREVSSVAGKVLVLNRYESLLTRLLASRFFITFDFGRAAQSRFGAVLCCPGALTAYRREAVLRVLSRWSRQTFLGSPCTIGEDRALTTWLLREGGRSVYQGSAIVRTLVPATVRGVTKMLLRWERGDIRENLILLPVLFTRWRERDRLFPSFEVVFELLQFPIGFLLLASMVGHFIEYPAHLLHLFAFVSLAALLQSLLCLRSERSTDFLYSVAYSLFAFIGLQWVYPYSFVTLRDGRWLTR